MNRLGVIAGASVTLLTALLFFLLLRGDPPAPESEAGSSKTAASESSTDPVREMARLKKELAGLQPRKPYIVIDTHGNWLYLRTADTVLYRAKCSTGSGSELVDSTTGRRWIFNTPRGVFKVNSKLTDPWWRKPDWAYIEESEQPPDDPSERYDPNMLGDFALGFGKGYFIHGTIYERLIGISVTHGCVRLGSEDLKVIYERTKIGTPVYIF